MTIAPTLRIFLERKHIEYDLIIQEPTMSSASTAEAYRISRGCLAKAVVLRSRDGYVLAVVPASRRIRLEELRRQFSDDLKLATEHEVEQLFPDCMGGAVPAVGECYGLDVAVDDSIREQSEVYFEGGDNATVVHMSRAQFARLTAQAPHGRFAKRS